MSAVGGNALDDYVARKREEAVVGGVGPAGAGGVGAVRDVLPVDDEVVGLRNSAVLPDLEDEVVDGAVLHRDGPGEHVRGCRRQPEPQDAVFVGVEVGCAVFAERFVLINPNVSDVAQKLQVDRGDLVRRESDVEIDGEHGVVELVRRGGVDHVLGGVDRAAGENDFVHGGFVAVSDGGGLIRLRFRAEGREDGAARDFDPATSFRVSAAADARTAPIGPRVDDAARDLD